jgi:hypothetical protein
VVPRLPNPRVEVVARPSRARLHVPTPPQRRNIDIPTIPSFTYVRSTLFFLLTKWSVTNPTSRRRVQRRLPNSAPRTSEVRR